MIGNEIMHLFMNLKFCATTFKLNLNFYIATLKLNLKFCATILKLNLKFFAATFSSVKFSNSKGVKLSFGYLVQLVLVFSTIQFC